ncbi:hypothetical protein CCAX7_54600 [Capsulimonas corticalis]|uniref:Uncharacterized protein n=1 Tax=Capsulimonas corticalis TaxID=2219043 RepID=A0A402D5Z8_9BACT|nr:hypothetical protein [Capsulimonas corticalis]BDI33409.1 hypothetical protein CCAX7_54600 [Capsulimonas corticalis]
MAIAFNVSGAINLFAAIIVDVLTIAGETVTALPQITSVQQVEFEGASLPLTVLEYGDAVSEQQGTGELISVPITVHHIRALEAGTGNAADTILARLQAIAQRVRSDYRLQSVTVMGSPYIEGVEEISMALGDKSEMQKMLNGTDQQESLAAASLGVVVKWFEYWT